MRSSWKPEVLVQGEWARNALVFATREEAEASARSLSYRWLLVADWRVAEVDEEPNYRFVDGHEVPIDKEKQP